MRVKTGMVKKRKNFSYLLRIIIVIAVLIVIATLLISQLKLNKSFNRNIAIYTLQEDTKKKITQDIAPLKIETDIIKYCSSVVAEMLSFDRKNMIPNGKANCVGYAQLTSAIINYAFQVKKLPYMAKLVVGKVYLFGIDLNNVAQKILPKKHRPFFKDHDFVEINLDDKTVFIDSSLQDLTGLTYMQINNTKKP